MTEQNKTFEEYLRFRFKDQISLYDHKANYNKRLHLLTTSALVVLSSFLPVGIIFLPTQYKMINVFVAVVLAILVALLRVFRFEDRWINLRSSAELLKREKMMFDVKVGEYSHIENPEVRFIERVESIISRENTVWLTTLAQRQDPRQRMPNKRS